MKKCPKCHLVSPDSTAICNCGFNLEDESMKVLSPNASEVENRNVSDISDHFIEGILCLLFCCLPFGMVAVYYSGKAKVRKELGDYEGALQDSKTARVWCRVAFWIGASIIIIWTIFNELNPL